MKKAYFTTPLPTGPHTYDLSYREGTKDEQILKEVIIQDCYFFNKWVPNFNPECIIDIGCQIGSFSAMASSRFQQAEVLSFEMDAENFEIAKSNLSAFDRCKVYNLSVCGKNPVLSYRKNKNNSGGNKALFKGSDSYISEGRFDKTKLKDTLAAPESINLEKILDDHQIYKVDFLKMDCEGSEHEIIPHLIESDLLKRIKNLSLELHGKNKKEYDYIVSSLVKHFHTVITVGNGNLVHCRDFK